MDELLPLQDSDWVVIKTRYEPELGQARRVTAQCFYAESRWSSREHRYSRHDVIFVGDESAAKLLHDQLVASYKQMQSERLEAIKNREARDAEFLRSARSAA